ncbi:uncharacterized protein LOC116116325 [Pistacia vera]|uniref:uncharacterized protein LOC116116325 n=1 Tax=Pistacia vera TaxID=55513 RepID=UPI001262F604|nr:uncharacterized protein LOC116116325 [Pistacia vera]
MEDTHDIDVITWGEFRRLFEAECRTVDRVHEKIQEFISLKQGSSTLKEYSVKFNSLARFVPGIMNTPKLRKDKFVHGLKPEIAQDVMAGVEPPRSYNEALERALRAKIFVNKLTPVGTSITRPSEPSPAPHRERIDVARNREMRNKKKFQPKKNRKDWQSKRPRTAEFPPCPKCGRTHPGECLRELGLNVCYYYRQPGHLMKDCRFPLPPTAQTSRDTNARVFTVAQGEAEASPLAITGQLLFHTVPLYALIDSEATYLFITYGMIERLGLKPVVVDQPIKIELLDGKICQVYL